MGTSNEAAVLEQVPTGLYVDGKWREATDARTLAVEDPSTGEVLREVADASPADAMTALDAAAAAQDDWARVPARERGEILRRAFEAVVARSEEIALLITLEMGKPLAESRAEVAYGAEFFRWFSEEAVRIGGEYKVAPDGKGRIITMRQPVGPCILITPWNFPLAMGTRKIGPAVAAGCTMVVKPAGQTPLTMLLLAQILEDCGLPPGVLNVVTTTQSGATMEPLIKDGRARKLSFTGSTGVGRTLIAQSADQVLRVSMELGGNAPFIVFDDADIDRVIEGALVAKMRNMGESCVAANRFFAAEPVAQAFAERLAERMGALKVGRGTEDGIDVGPMIDGSARDGIHRLVADAVDRGATPLVGGEPLDGVGHFYPPTVLMGVSSEAEMVSGEIFGPVAPVIPFDDEDAVIEAANATEYGLIAYVYTSDLERALRVTERLETGMVGVNRGLVSNPAAPFGGVKHSGLGREGGQEGIGEFLETKYVAVALDA